MAGIGFELRRYLKDDTFTGSLKAYGFAGVISAGPWLLSILGVMLIGIIAFMQDVGSLNIRQFTTSVTWMMGGSLVLTGLLQLMFTRFVADRIFEKQLDIINPNLLGVLLLTTLVSGLLGCVLALFKFDETVSYEILMIGNFVVLSNIWMAVIFVAGLKRFKLILGAFAIAYSATIVLAVLLMPLGLNGLLAGLLMGHSVLLFLMLAVILPEHPLVLEVRFDFLKRRQIFLSLAAIGFFYNLGIWIDKVIFWLEPSTSEQIIGPLRSSLIYDLPIFLAYLSIIPGMAVFLLRIETDFVQTYEDYFDAVRGNASLQEIESLGDQMVVSVHNGLLQIVRVQGATILILYLAGPTIINWLGISSQYVQLYYVNLVGVGAQVLMLAVLNVLFYLDKLKQALYITLILLLSNACFTLLSLEFGPAFYGDGFGFSMTLTALVSLVVLSRELSDLEFNTFMTRSKETVSS